MFYSHATSHKADWFLLTVVCYVLNFYRSTQSVKRRRRFGLRTLARFATAYLCIPYACCCCVCVFYFSHTYGICFKRFCLLFSCKIILDLFHLSNNIFYFSEFFFSTFKTQMVKESLITFQPLLFESNISSCVLLKEILHHVL